MIERQVVRRLELVIDLVQSDGGVELDGLHDVLLDLGKHGLVPEVDLRKLQVHFRPQIMVDAVDLPQKLHANLERLNYRRTVLGTHEGQTDVPY